MTHEDKELLLQDLSARLPYEVMCNIGLKYPLQLQRIFVDRLDGILLDFYEDGDDYQVYLSEVKPYLRPMSSMTEEERKEIGNLIKENRPNPHGIINNKGIDNLLFSVSVTSGFLIEWLNARHFDYKGLIEKGLAIKAPEGMYNVTK